MIQHPVHLSGWSVPLLLYQVHVQAKLAICSPQGLLYCESLYICISCANCFPGVGYKDKLLYVTFHSIFGENVVKLEILLSIELFFSPCQYSVDFCLLAGNFSILPLLGALCRSGATNASISVNHILRFSWFPHWSIIKLKVNPNSKHNCFAEY